jgi:hypothetical protein
MANTKSLGASKRILKLEFDRKKEILLREKQLDLALEKRHLGIDNFKKGDVKPFVEKTKAKLKRMRKDNLIK